MKSNSIVRIPSLDGLRAVSILLVLFSHSFSGIKHYADIGNLGVRMFFVISSYLIAGILLRDVEKNRFSLKRFYFKRIMRTFPAFYFYLAILSIVLVLTNHFEWSQFWYAPFYLENYHPRSLWTENQWFTGHTWSLAVEEQFYLLIALLFGFLFRKKIKINRLIYILLSVILIVPIIRISYMLLDFIPSFLKGSMHRSFETVADALAVGALLAILRHKIELNIFFKKLGRFPVLLIIIILSLLFFNSSYAVSIFGYASRLMYNSVGIFFINVALGVLMISAINANEKSFFYRILNYQPLVFIGLFSYSIYLWQQLWLFDWPLPLYIKWLGIAGSSLFSYYLIEEKFLVIRDRIVAKKRF